MTRDEVSTMRSTREKEGEKTNNKRLKNDFMKTKGSELIHENDLKETVTFLLVVYSIS